MLLPDILHFSDNKSQNTCQPGLGAWGASLSSPGRHVRSDLIGAGNRQMVNVRQDHIVPNSLRLANMAWTFDLSKLHALTILHFVWLIAVSGLRQT